MSYLLDTNVCIHFLRGDDSGLRTRFLACPPDQLYLCSIVKAELLFGARKSQRVDANLLQLERFFQPLQSLPFDDNAAEHYSMIRAVLERQGTPVGGNDMMIAATALTEDLTLATRNVREFARIPGLRVEAW